ncbi:MAG: DUF1848 domain-containing protein [Chitinispirillaceae bacterium]|nr:DUF1848 domain-containing protein [Chitinispirillaceae bacterium]
MKSSPWPRVSIITDDGQSVPAIAPLIISASRATDIPALFGDWLLDRLAKGHIRWTNPFNGKPQFVSFENTRLIVFWSKNPAPFLPHLDKIDRKGIRYFFQLTVNDYERERFEPGIPQLDNRISATIDLAHRIGKEKLLWRFDPLILTDTLTTKRLLEKIERIGDRIAHAVSRLTVSFLTPYRSVLRRMLRSGIDTLKPSAEAVESMGSGLAALGKKWGVEVVTCSENADMSAHGILPGSCIDPLYIGRVFSEEPALMRLIGTARDNNLFEEPAAIRLRLKDPGQRPLCGCMISKDIGSYGTCTQGCIYCYARGRTTQHWIPTQKS